MSSFWGNVYLSSALLRKFITYTILQVNRWTLLGWIPPFILQELQDHLSDATGCHRTECNRLFKKYVTLFPKWIFQLRYMIMILFLWYPLNVSFPTGAYIHHILSVISLDLYVSLLSLAWDMLFTLNYKVYFPIPAFSQVFYSTALMDSCDGPNSGDCRYPSSGSISIYFYSTLFLYAP